jgi:hypothetical protein
VHIIIIIIIIVTELRVVHRKFTTPVAEGKGPDRRERLVAAPASSVCLIEKRSETSLLIAVVVSVAPKIHYGSRTFRTS